MQGKEGLGRKVQADLGDVVGSVPDDHNKANITVKRVMENFWFPSAYKSYVYTLL